MSTTYDFPSVEAMTYELLGHYEAASPETLTSGRAWYDVARREARRLSREYGLTFRQVAGIVAALSPQKRWSVNLRLAETVCETGTCGEQTRTQVWKAEYIREGQSPLSVLKGPKERSFYRAIVGDLTVPVVDTWMSYAAGQPTVVGSGRRYRETAEAIVRSAQVAGEHVVDFQAIVWVHVRGGAE